MKLLYVLVVLSLIAAVFAGGPSACKMQRKMAEGKKGEFVPKCDKNGDYAQVQCKDGWCWCAKKDGTQLGKSQQGKPNCAGQPR